MQLSRKTAPLLGLATLAALGLAAPAVHAQGFQGPYDPSNFTASGSSNDGGISESITPSSGPTPAVDFSYNAGYYGGYGQQASADFTTTAAGTGQVTFDYSYNGFNAYYYSYSHAYVEDYTTGDSFYLGGDGSTGSGSLFVNQGDTFGFHLDGGNYDYDSRSINTLTVSNFNAPGDVTATPEPSSVAAFAFTGLGAAGLMLKARKRKVAAD